MRDKASQIADILLISASSSLKNDMQPELAVTPNSTLTTAYNAKKKQEDKD